MEGLFMFRLRFFVITVFLLLIFIQLFCSGVFIRTDKALTGPLYSCAVHGGRSCDGWYMSSHGVAESDITITILTDGVTVCYYTPVVFVAFALLSTLLADYAKDRAAFWFSMICQAASTLLIQTAAIFLLLLYCFYVTWESISPWFNICVGVQLQLVITTALTWQSIRRLPSDWE